MAELVLDEEMARSFARGTAVTIYLAPHNYHRVHAALDGVIDIMYHVPGKKWPVSPRLGGKLPGLFSANERVVISAKDKKGAVWSTVMVGAAGVRRIEVFGGSVTESEKTLPKAVVKGEDLAAFRLGSTVILLLPKSYRVDKHVGEKVSMGEPLAQGIAQRDETAV